MAKSETRSVMWIKLEKIREALKQIEVALATETFPDSIIDDVYDAHQDVVSACEALSEAMEKLK